MECHIGVISGDGIGPEIVAEAKKVLDKAGEKYGHSFTYQDVRSMRQACRLPMRQLQLQRHRMQF